MEFAEGAAVVVAAPPAEVAVSGVHVWCGGRPEVVVGQRVKVGAAVSETPAGRGGSISPIAGTVRRIVPVVVAGEGPTQTVMSHAGARAYVVSVEAEQPRSPTDWEAALPNRLRLDAWLPALRRVGHWLEPALGPSVIRQLETCESRPPQRLVCVGLDRFPPQPLRSSLLASFPEEAVVGTRLLADLCGAPDAVLLMSRRPRLSAALRPFCRDFRVRLLATDNVYPAADPTLVAARLGTTPESRRLPFGANPAEHGLVLVSPWTVIRLGRWYRRGRLDIARPQFFAFPHRQSTMTVTWALPGQPLAELDGALSGDALQLSGRLIVGDAMTGRPIVPAKVVRTADDAGELGRFDLDDGWTPPPTVGEAELLLTVLSPPGVAPEEPCISCGWCVDVCPTRLQPIRLVEQLARERRSAAVDDQRQWCIRCGLCTHACPSAIPLAQRIAQG